MRSVSENESRSIFVDDGNLRCANCFFFPRHFSFHQGSSILIGSVGYIMESRSAAHFKQIAFYRFSKV